VKYNSVTSTLKQLLETKMFFITLVTYVFLSITSGAVSSKVKYNPTVNNAFDFGLWIMIFALFCPIVFLLSYLIIQIVKRKTSFLFSALHLAAIILTAVLPFYFYDIQLIILLLFVFQILMFILNLLVVFKVLGKK